MANDRRRSPVSFRALFSGPFFIVKSLQREALLRLRPPLSGRVLDIGCGTRPFRDLVESSAYVGMDADENVQPDVCGSSEALPFADASFDAVVCTEVLEHVVHPSACIAEASRVLANGGRLYITAPMCWGLHYEPYDYWRFTNHGLTRLLRDSGFSVISVERYGGVFSLAAQRLIDVCWTVCSRILGPFLGVRCAERIATAFTAPLSVCAYISGKLFDRIDKRDALGWVAVARK